MHACFDLQSFIYVSTIIYILYVDQPYCIVNRIQNPAYPETSALPSQK